MGLSYSSFIFQFFLKQKSSGTNLWTMYFWSSICCSSWSFGIRLFANWSVIILVNNNKNNDASSLLYSHYKV